MQLKPVPRYHLPLVINFLPVESKPEGLVSGYDPGENPTYVGTVSRYTDEQQSSPDCSTTLYHRLQNPLYGATDRQGTPEYAAPEYATPEILHHPTSGGTASDYRELSHSNGSLPASTTEPGQYCYIDREASLSSGDSQKHQYDYITASGQGWWLPESSGSGSDAIDRSVVHGDSSESHLGSTDYERMP